MNILIVAPWLEAADPPADKDWWEHVVTKLEPGGRIVML